MAANEYSAKSLLGKFSEERELDSPLVLLSRQQKRVKSTDSALGRVI